MLVQNAARVAVRWRQLRLCLQCLALRDHIAWNGLRVSAACMQLLKGGGYCSACRPPHAHNERMQARTYPATARPTAQRPTAACSRVANALRLALETSSRDPSDSIYQPSWLGSGKSSHPARTYQNQGVNQDPWQPHLASQAIFASVCVPPAPYQYTTSINLHHASDPLL